MVSQSYDFSANIGHVRRGKTAALFCFSVPSAAQEARWNPPTCLSAQMGEFSAIFAKTLSVSEISVFASKRGRSRVAKAAVLQAKRAAFARLLCLFCTLVVPVLHRRRVLLTAQNRRFVQPSSRFATPKRPEWPSENYSMFSSFSRLQVLVEPFPRPDCSVFRFLRHASRPSNCLSAVTRIACVVLEHESIEWHECLRRS